MCYPRVGMIFFFFFNFHLFDQGRGRCKHPSCSCCSQFASLAAPWKWIQFHKEPEYCAVHHTVPPSQTPLPILPPPDRTGDPAWANLFTLRCPLGDRLAEAAEETWGAFPTPFSNRETCCRLKYHSAEMSLNLSASMSQ